jgi:GAF domain-containing protein
MEPIPETAEALTEAGRYLDDSLLDLFRAQGRLVREIVPSCWGMSLTFAQEQLTFTLVASQERVAALDGVQVLDGGPCIDALRQEQDLAVRDLGDPLNEQRWRLFAELGAAAGVRSTLSFPLRDDGKIIGGVNLYASEVGAFEAHVEELAAGLRASATEAVRNADLPFASRDRAVRAPAKVHDTAMVAQAVGVLIGAQGISVDEAQRRLDDAASQVGVPVGRLAELVLEGLDRSVRR